MTVLNAFCTGLVALALASALPCAAMAEVVVRVAPETVVRADEISLGEIASIDGDEPLAGRLRQVRLGRAPAPGITQRLDLDYLRLRLNDAQLEPDNVRLIVPDQLVVTRAFQVVPGSALVDTATRTIQERLRARSSSDEPYAIAALARPADLRAPAGALELVAQVQGEPSTAGTVAAAVAVKVDGRSFQTVPLSFRIGRYQTVVVAVHALATKAALGPADWRIEQRPSTEIPAGALSTIADDADLEAAQPIKAGEVLTGATVRQRIVVKRGDVVTLLLEGPGFRITTQGVAVTDGRRGDSLRVLNTTSKREAVGKLEPSGIVRVPFRGMGSDR